jgi:PST family polysaccharide transporter
LALISIAVLARLLPPSDFGIVAMAGAVNAMFGVFKDAGLSTATIQRATISQFQVSNLFWFNLTLGASMTVVTIVAAPAAAWFYHDPRLMTVIIALSLTFIAGGCTVQHDALLVRDMRFLSRAVISLTSTSLGFVVACALALKGFGYWSLVYMQLATSGSALVLTWVVSGWRPSLPRRNTGTRSLVNFGANLTAAAAIFRIASSADTFFLGRLFGAEAVGIYSRAVALLVRPLDQVLMPAGAVLLPGLSRVQGDDERYRRGFAFAFDGLAFLCFPLTALLSALADPIVRVSLGDRWEAVIPIFAALSFAGVYSPLAYMAAWLMESQGRGRDYVRANAVLALLTIAAILGGLVWGPLGVAWALSISGLLVRVPFLYYFATRRGPVSSSFVWHRVLYHLPAWAAVFVTASLTEALVTDMNSVLQLAICVPVAVAAGALTILLPRSSRESALAIVHAFRTSRMRASA